MHPLAPGFIQERFLAGETGGSNPGGEFPAVGLFLDISGFSTITDALMAHGQHGAEVLAQVMRAIFDPVINHIFAQGGFVATSAGDSLTALFPLAEDEDEPGGAWRALAAAWNIQQEMAARTTFPTIYQTFTISARVGLADGLVRWGILTAQDSQRGVYYFQGQAIDDSALAQQQAPVGRVALSAALAGRLGTRVAAEPVPSEGQPSKPGVVLLTNLADPLAPLFADLPAPATHREALSQFYPQAVIDLETSGEFRQATNLLISLPTVRTETQLRIFMESVFDLQDTYGGLINRLDFGDKGTNLILFWGAPTAHENDIERALDFILDLQASTSIPISAGVACQIAHAGFIGGRLFEEYTCFGRGVNLAARFMTSAPRGEIWVDETIARRAGQGFEIEYVEERRFKGFGQPQKIYTLLGRKEPEPVFYQGGLVGREESLAILSGFIAPIFAGQPAGLLLVSGEAGIGKSRLVHAFLDDLEANRPGAFQFFLGQTDEIVRQPFNPFVYWLRRYFDLSAAQGEARSKRSFNRKLDDLIAATQDSRLAEELDRTRSFLGALVGLRWADSLFEQLDAEARYHNTLLGLIALLQAESRRKPVVLALEDIHQLDQDSLAFLPFLMRSLASDGGEPYPVALLCTARCGLAELSLDGPDCKILALPGLDQAGLRALAHTHLGGAPASGLLVLLAERAEGNPFYAEQILLYLKAEDLLERGQDGWDYRRGRGDALPVEISSLLVARLDHLAREVKEAVQTAAVLGREFDIRLLSCMLGWQDSPGAPEEIGAAEQEGIWARLGEIRCLFRHMLMREAAYQMQVHTRRQRMHALALEAYETLYGDDLSGHYGELAYHAEQAGLVEPACRYLRLAGEAACETYQNSQAVVYFTRALALLREEDLAARCGLHLAREGLYEAMGQDAERQAELAALAALRPQLSEAGQQVEIILRQAMCAVDNGQYSVAVAHAEEALALAGTVGLAACQGRAHQTLALASLRRGRLAQAEEHSLAALRLANESGSQVDELSAYNILGLTAQEQGRLDAARQSFTRCLELARQLGRLSHQIAPLNNLAKVAHQQGDLASALDFYQQSVAVARQAGNRSREGMALGNLGFLSGILGEYAAALGYLEASLQINRASGQALFVAYGLCNLSACAGALGDHQRAESAARECLALARELEDSSAEAWGQTYLGHSLLARGELGLATESYAAALAIRKNLAQPGLATEPAAGLARVALEQADLLAARAWLDPVLGYLEEGGSLDAADEPLRVYLTCWRVLEQVGDPRAHPLLETAHNLLQARAAQIPSPATRQAFLTNIAHHREIVAAWERANQ